MLNMEKIMVDNKNPTEIKKQFHIFAIQGIELISREYETTNIYRHFSYWRVL